MEPSGVAAKNVPPTGPPPPLFGFSVECTLKMIVTFFRNEGPPCLLIADPMRIPLQPNFEVIA
jgi:hypothetical protein